jgi:SNF2 family DNA or RNA helicase
MHLRDFLEKHGNQLASTIERNLTPVYNPLNPEGIEEFEGKMPMLLRKPFPVQSELIKGISKALYKVRRHHLFVTGEMGCGKTMIALSTVAMSSFPQRVLVVCPTHLVEKWIRETKWTIPEVHVVDLSVRNIISILSGLRDEKMRPQIHEVYVISKERAKLSYGWRPAAVKKSGSKFPHCPDCGAIAMKGDEYVTWSNVSNKRYHCSKCGSALWQADRKLRRFAPAEYIKRYLKNFFDLVILDEIQDYKAGDSLQGRTMGALLSVSKRCLCLTGTLNGGYADDLFYLLFRMEPASLKANGFEHSSSNKWLETYGTLEMIRYIEDEDHYYGRGRRNGQMMRKRPGVSPLVIGKYLLDKACFVRLADIIDGLPPYEENVVTLKMDSTQVKEYSSLESKLRMAVKEFKGKALSAMLQALLSYPDSCVLFPENIEIKDKLSGTILGVIKAPLITLEKGKLLPKEAELLKLAQEEKPKGRKVLCYLTFTNSRDIRPRLKKVLEERKFRVGILDASVEPKKREAWINKHTKDIDVLLVNAELVKTGLDLYDFPTVVFYQIGYNIFSLRQAARRSWRIGQQQPVKVLFFCYGETMQEVALTLIAKKLEVALLVEGDLPEGLAEYAAEDSSIIEEMGKALAEGGTYRGAEVAWANFRKKEIEAQLGISGRETIFSEASKAVAKSADTLKTKTTIDKNVVVKVSIVEDKKKKQSILEVKYGDLDSVLNGRPAQFAMF